MPIVSTKQLFKLARLVDKKKVKREVFNALIDDTEDITKLPNKLIKKDKKL